MAAQDGLLFEFGIFGDRLIRRRFMGMIDAIDDMRPAWHEVAEMIYAVEAAQFDSQGARGPSGVWAPLRLSTLRRRAARGTGSRILVDTGDLRDDVTSRDGPNSIYHVFDSWMQIGTEHPGAVHHQHGTRRMAKRRIFDFTEDDKRTILKPIQLRILATGARRDRRFTAL